MLFDLRGRGRRTTIKIIYVTLALLMGGGLVLFGIGGDVSGGLVDAITERGGGGDTGEERFQKQEEAALLKTRRSPQDAAAWAELARARVSLAGFGDRLDQNTGQYSEEGKAKLAEAGAAWEKYLALDPPMNEATASLASRMVQAYAALGDFAKATTAQEIITEQRPKVGTFATLATLAYEAGQTRKGDLAAKKALDLAPRDERETLRGTLESAKQRSIASQITPPAED